MNQILKSLQKLSIQQRLSLIAVAVLVVGGILALAHWNRERNFKPLYSQLSNEDAAAVVAKLKETGIDYRFGGDSGTILVPSSRIPELRLEMASSGIPKSGRIGYELFDRTNLSLTDFTEQVNYHRAIEGELERSVMSMNEVDQARVHITFPKDSVFTENRQPAKASVMVKLKTGQRLSRQNAQAISQLVASAVEGLTPEAVSVMDMQGNLLIRPKKPGDGSEPSEELLTWKKQLEGETLAKINSVLDPLLGSSKYRASVDIDCDQTSGEQSEETFDPTRSVITSSQRTEEGSINRESNGVPGTQSNLPRPAPRASATVGGGVARRTENMNYETSRTVRKIKMPQGIVRRMSISVLIDNNVRWEPAARKGTWPKKIVAPPTTDELKVIHDVVAAAAGFNGTRGDQLTVDSLPFAATLHAQPPDWMVPAKTSAPQTAPALWKQRNILIGAGAGLVVLLLAGFLVLGARKKRRKVVAEMQKQLEEAQTAKQKAIEASEAAAVREPEPVAVAAADDKFTKQIAEIRESFKLPPLLTTKTEVLTKQLIEEARKDPSALAQIVRSWLNESK
ncbi:MAG TPA: flagellar basal-body MS-ring/collar protein FliF [Bryobacteraceae bacterium]|nr:flagellar basal-body MS-ring/collar protein FliF [Bryobacteraceae bacterium]